MEKEPPPSFPMGCCTAPPSRVAALSPDPAPLARSSRVAPPPSPRCTGLASPRLSAALLLVPSPVACAPRPVWPGRGPQPAAASRARWGLAAPIHASCQASAAPRKKGDRRTATP